MQVTTQVQEKEQGWLNKLLLLGGISVGVLLFALVIGRMGLLNGLRGGGATAVSPTTITVTTQNMQFGQSTLRIQAGEPVNFLLANKDFYGHSFDIDALDWHVPMPANDEVAIDFTAVPPGTYTIYCAVPGHREAGMVTTLVVEN